jgi:transposase-like protein
MNESRRKRIAQIEKEYGLPLRDVILDLHFSLSYREIAKRLGVSEVTLIKWRRRERLFVKSKQHGRMRKNLARSIERRYHRPIKEVILLMHERERNWHATANVLGISYRTLIRWRRNMEIK